MLSFLVIGMALHGILTMPYALQLANGWTRLTIGTNVVAIVVLAPALVLLAKLYGGIGAAVVWPISLTSALAVCSAASKSAAPSPS